MKEFATFQPPFNEEKTEFLLETAKANIKNNKETLLREINKAVLRKQSRKRVGDDLGAQETQVRADCHMSLLVICELTVCRRRSSVRKEMKRDLIVRDDVIPLC